MVVIHPLKNADVLLGVFSERAAQAGASPYHTLDGWGTPASRRNAPSYENSFLEYPTGRQYRIPRLASSCLMPLKRISRSETISSLHHEQ
jgi:hypothetical protein